MEEITLDKEMWKWGKVNHFKMCKGPFPSGLINGEATPPLIEPTNELIREFKPTKELTEKEIEEILKPKNKKI